MSWRCAKLHSYAPIGAGVVALLATCSCDSGRLVTLGVSASSTGSEVEPVVEPEVPATEPEPSAPMGGGGAGAEPAPEPVVGGSAGSSQPSPQPEPAPEPTVAQEPVFSEPVEVSELSSNEHDDNPTLTADLLQIYFTSLREGGPGNTDVWFAERASVEEPFLEPSPVEAVSTPEFDSSPSISADGLMLWVGLELEEGQGGLDIWVSSRGSRDDEWSSPINVPELNSSEDDLPRPLGDGERVMPIQSRRDGGSYQMFLAPRETTSGRFGTPLRLQSFLVEGQAMGDGFVTNDGLGFYFAYSADSVGDIFFASRNSSDEDFGTAVAVSSLNTEFDERDPWLSADGTRFYFASDRGGVRNIYTATLLSGGN